MRIRKRQVPLPLSSLLPVPLSDLYFRGGGDDGGFASLPSSISDRLIQREVLRKKKEEEKALVSFLSIKNNVNPLGESNSSTQVIEENEKGVSLRKRRSFISFEEHEEEEEEASGGNKGKKKRAKKSGTLEEGSRCSRVNGRGWRCCQQTLFGYSLCEHHLGKGRVRSMNKTRGGDKKAVVVDVMKKKSKRVKLGMVKARSISSLLGQTSTSISGSNADVVVAVANQSEISALADQFVGYDK
ncbi:unnamed protein product [Cochlearia groenlandica]